MATLGVRSAIAHAAVDDAFRQNFLAEPAKACSSVGYDLSSEELSSVMEVIADDSFGASFNATQNLPELFQETTSLVNEAGPLADRSEADEFLAV